MKLINKGLIISLLGVFLFSYQNITNHKKIEKEENKIFQTLAKETGYNYKNNDTYDGIIEIPQINLQKGFYQKNDKRNNINENITIHNMSTYPNEDNSNLILMAHSGNGEKAYFNDLPKLNTDSLIKIYYQISKKVQTVILKLQNILLKIHILQEEEHIKIHGYLYLNIK